MTIKINILSWYVAKDFCRYLFFCLVAMLALLIVANMFGNIESVFSGWKNFTGFLDETVLSFPTMLEIILPMAVLLATVMTFSGFSRSSELVAMKIAGMGRARLILPLFLVLVPVAALSYLSQNYLFNVLHPDGVHNSALRTNSLWRSQGQKIYYFRKINSKKKRIAVAVVFDWKQGPFRVRQIESIHRGRRSEKTWNFSNITTREESGDTWILRRKRKASLPVEEFPDVFRHYELDAHHMPFLDLYEVIRQPENRNIDVVVYLLEWYQKIAVLFAPFVMVLVGAPLSQFHQRSSRVAGDLVVTIIGGVVYWISNEIFLILGKGSILHPFLSAWGVNLLFILLGILLLLRTR